MYIPAVIATSAALVGLVRADFHIVAENPTNSQGQIVAQTNIFVIGSNDDTHDNKCSHEATGKFSAAAKNVLVKGDCSAGLCLTNAGSFTFPTSFCGLDAGTQFRKSNLTEGSFLFLDNNNNMLGKCFSAGATQESCIGESDGKKFLAGDIVDLLFCQVDGNPSFCDSVF